MADRPDVLDGPVSLRDDARRPERDAIANAIAARLQLNDDERPQDDQARAKTVHTAKVRRTINEMSGAVSYEKASACLELMHRIIDNIVRQPDEDKYRSFRAKQPKIAREMLVLPQASDLLVLAGFRKRTHDFQEEWFVPRAHEWGVDSLGFRRLQWTGEAIADRMQEYKEAAERAQTQRLQQASIEQSRKARALADVQSDRERVALRVERERAARRAQAERQGTEEQEHSDGQSVDATPPERP